LLNLSPAPLGRPLRPTRRLAALSAGELRAGGSPGFSPGPRTFVRPACDSEYPGLRCLRAFLRPQCDLSASEPAAAAPSTGDDVLAIVGARGTGGGERRQGYRWPGFGGGLDGGGVRSSGDDS